MGIESLLLAGANAFGGSALGGAMFQGAMAASALPSLSTGLSILSGVSSLMGGMQAKQEGKIQAANAMADARARGAEEARVAAREADLTQQEADSVRRRQKVAFLKSGVSLAGSPLLVMEETRRKGKENVDEILASGTAASKAAYQEGRTQARAYKSQGRQAFTEGLVNAGSAFGRLM